MAPSSMAAACGVSCPRRVAIAREVEMARVLIVDDESALRRVLRIGLERRGHAVEEAGDGAEALVMLRHAPADVAVVDLAMPVMGGLELTARLRRDYPALKIVVMTGGAGHGAVELLRMADRVGADVALSKPFGRSELASAVEGVPSAACVGSMSLAIAYGQAAVGMPQP
jgi:two-component system KDP operon response regulator KdpE